MRFHLSPGTLLEGRYEIESGLGVGGMGEVYVALHRRIDRRVALKLLVGGDGRDPTEIERFRQEARVLGRLGHPGFVDVLDVGETDDGQPFIVMELLTGEPVSRLVPQAPLSIPLCLRLGIDLLETLAVAHAQGIIHRDIKPENLFLAQIAGVPRLKILDFGLAKLEGEGSLALTAKSVPMGSVRYMAPEQADSARDARAAADLFAVGALLYRLLTGRSHVEGESLMSVLGQLMRGEFQRDPAALRPEIPPALAEVVATALSLDPAQRPASARAMADVLEEVAGPSLPELPDLLRASPLGGWAEVASPDDAWDGPTFRPGAGAGERSPAPTWAPLEDNPTQQDMWRPQDVARWETEALTPSPPAARGPAVLPTGSAPTYPPTPEAAPDRTWEGLDDDAPADQAPARAAPAPTPAVGSPTKGGAPRTPPLQGVPAPIDGVGGDHRTWRLTFGIIFALLVVLAGALWIRFGTGEVDEGAAGGPGWLMVESVPPGAVVRVDGEESPRGQTPLRVGDLPIDRTVTLRLTLPGYRAATQVAQASADGARVEVSLGQGIIELTVRSTPSGATVLIDGAPVGETPLTGPLLDPDRPTLLRVEAPGRVPFEERLPPAAAPVTREITLDPAPESGDAPASRRPAAPGARRGGPAPDVAPETVGEVGVAGAGRVRVEGTPAGLRIKVDGVARGAAPLTLELPVGPHDITAEADGYEPQTREVPVGAGGEASLRFSLVEAAAEGQSKVMRVFVNAPIPGARVLLDGVPQGVVPQTLKVAPGEHVVAVEADGHPTWEAPLSVPRRPKGELVRLEAVF